MFSISYSSPQVLQTVEVRLEEGMLVGASTVRTVETMGIRSFEVDDYEENNWVDNSDPNIQWD
jgi:hypothetical protein